MSTHPNIIHSPSHLGGVVQVDSEATRETLGIMSKDLSADSHERVIVFCTNCGEQFQRELRNIHLPHACPRFLMRNGEKLQKCAACSKYTLLEDIEEDVCSACDTDDVAPDSTDTPVRLECRRRGT